MPQIGFPKKTNYYSKTNSGLYLENSRFDLESENYLKNRDMHDATIKINIDNDINNIKPISAETKTKTMIGSSRSTRDFTTTIISKIFICQRCLAPLSEVMPGEFTLSQKIEEIEGIEDYYENN